jgi:small-conductance mechanosensitive channel/CRP-like cAMP-binding protein
MMVSALAATAQASFINLPELTLEDALLLLSWLLFLLIYAFTRVRPRLRVFRAPILLLVLSATISRAVTLFHIQRAASVVTFLFVLSIAFLAARLVVFVFFDLIIDRRREVATPALIKSLVFFGLLLFSLVILNESLPEAERVSLTSLLASAAVISVVLGFALQDTLGNLFSGLAIHLEGPVKVGHWIKLGDSIGKVVETDWRSVKLLTLSRDFRIIPNSLFSSQLIINYSDPPTPHRRELLVRAPYSASPDNVVSAILRVLEAHQTVLNTPKPSVLMRNFGDHWIDYEVRYFYTDYGQLEVVDGEIRRQVWYHFRRARVESPLPVREVFLHEVKPEAVGRAERLEKMSKRFRSIHLFESLTDSELQQVVEGMQMVLYAAGETIIRQGSEGDSFFIIWSGEAEVSVRREDGSSAVVKVLKSGDYFGEMALLTGERRTATITALSECTCYILGKPIFKKVLEANPSIAEDLSERLGARQAELDEQLSALEAKGREKRKDGGRQAITRQILGKIRKYFGLQ